MSINEAKRQWTPIENMEDASKCNIPLDRPIEVKDEYGNTYIAKLGKTGPNVTKGFVIEGDSGSYYSNQLTAFRNVPEEW